ncbi:MAG: GNAT family N-acetyltransferase [Chloroflexi bacterium]|nr:GNAT family N-acetyltransferase [Chloroflexota bacterium]
MTLVIANTQEQITARPVQSEADWWRVRDLLIETYPITPPDLNWEIRRWEGWRFYGEDRIKQARWTQETCLWETAGGKLVGAVHPEYRGDAFLELHPDYRHIEEDMIAWAEEHLALPNDGGQQELEVFVYEYNTPRQRLLERRGYEKLAAGGVIRHMRFGNKVLPEVNLAKGYTLRTMDPHDPAVCQALADLLNAAFNRDFHTPDEFHLFGTQAPSFREDLHLAAYAPDGTMACHVGVIFEETNRYGLFEPVCTHPDHVRKGLARALMFEGLHRLKALGATDVYVGTGDQVAANKLYEAIGFTETYKGYTWRKVW